MRIQIATGNSRMEKRWNNVEMELDEFINRISHTIRTAETVEQYGKMTKAKQDAIKDVGGFVMGKLKGGRRKKDCVEFRSALTLDMDHAMQDIPEQVEMFFDFRCLIYSTHKHTQENPRLRLIIPLTRNVSPDEYVAVARKVAEDIGIEMFDDTTYEPSRLMYWPSTSSDGEFIFRDIEGGPLNPDDVLSRYKDWRESSEWPVSSRQQNIVQREMRKQADPLSKDGVIGAFCRTYSIEETIANFLSDVYQPSAMPGRYDYIPADSQAGVVIYEGKFAYSHHATDPACGKLMNAFDMVRIHKYGDLDEKISEDTEASKLPSFTAMSEFAVNDENVKMTIAGERMEKAEKEFSGENGDWLKQLEYEKRSTVVKNTLRNLLLILNNDEKLKGIVFNQLSDGMEIKGEVPWEHPSRFWRDADDAQLISYVDLTYGTFSARNYDIAVTKVADDRSYHPIREFLSSLPEWDRVPRVDTIIDYKAEAKISNMISEYVADLKREMQDVKTLLNKANKEYSINLLLDITCKSNKIHSALHPQIDTQKIAIDYSAMKDILFEQEVYPSKFYGIREIIQNSYDACKAFWEIRGDNSNWDPKIIIRYDLENNTLRINDNGIGMTERVVKEYFLSIGKSIYNFESKYLYEGCQKDHIGHFGLGFFAAFMLSSEIEIHTQSYLSDKSIMIELNKDTNYATLTYNCQPIEHGTEVILKFDEVQNVLKINNKDECIDILCQYIVETFVFDGINIIYKDANNNKKLNLNKIEVDGWDNISQYLANIDAYINLVDKKIPYIFYANSQDEFESVTYEELLKQLALDYDKNCEIPFLDAGLFYIFPGTSTIKADFENIAVSLNPRRNYSLFTKLTLLYNL